MIYNAYILVYGQHWNICVFIYQLGLENTQKSLMLNYISKCKPPWRNWLARSAVNRKVGGSSPPGGAYFYKLLLYQLYFHQNNLEPARISVKFR